MSRPLIFGCTKDDKVYQEQVLPALLGKTKITTIRPMWKEEFQGGDRGWVDIPKKPQYKVGDVCKALWKPRSKGKLFCNGCGSPFIEGNIGKVTSCNGVEVKPFKKQLGEVKIKKIIPVNIVRNSSGFNMVDKDDIPCHTTNIARDDGFRSGSQMMYWLSHHYDLTTPKPFEIRRFSWL